MLYHQQFAATGCAEKTRNLNLFARCASEHLCANTVVICLATRGHNRGTQWEPFQHTHNRIVLHTQCRHKNKHIHHTDTLSTLRTRTLLINIHETHTTNTCCHRERLNEVSVLQPLTMYVLTFNGPEKSHFYCIFL